MAKFEGRLQGNFYKLSEEIKLGILNGSTTATLEDESHMTFGDVKCSVFVFERFSFAGSNRVSLNVVLCAQGDDIRISAITSGGSQATFFKINTLGEETFLEKLEELIRPYVK